MGGRRGEIHVLSKDRHKEVGETGRVCERERER